jgi:hypothetical protein
LFELSVRVVQAQTGSMKFIVKISQLLFAFEIDAPSRRISANWLSNVAQGEFYGKEDLQSRAKDGRLLRCQIAVDLAKNGCAPFAFLKFLHKINA